ncbi:hypothetical protein, partial [Longibacter salinarum]|uniref:hypothetical protein n=1 Tax=Longibacter salinarum TaxID=1850348 RepID=UPI001C54F82C
APVGDLGQVHMLGLVKARTKAGQVPPPGLTQWRKLLANGSLDAILKASAVAHRSTRRSEWVSTLNLRVRRR